MQVSCGVPKPRRGHCGAIVAFCVLLLVTAACTGTPTNQQVNAPSPDPTIVEPGPEPPLPVGMSDGGPFASLPTAQLNRELDLSRDAGVKWIRIDIDWSAVEAHRGEFDWADIDRAVRATRAHGLAVLGILDYSPRWAQDPSVAADNAHGRPANPQLFGDFARVAATHYAGQIDAWEIWNEPNLGDFFAPKPDAGYYTRLLQASYQSIHSVLPAATVIGGSLGPARDEADGSTISPTTFLRQMYTAGAKNNLDAVSAHPYSYPFLPSDPRTASLNAFYKLRDVHAVMQRNGDGAKLLWLTEFGAPTATVRNGAGAVVIDEQRQAAIIADGLRSAGQLGYIGPVFIYSIRDEKTDDPEPAQNFGVLRSDLSPKQSYAVIRRYTKAR